MKNEGIISALYILLLLLFFPNIIEVATYSISLKVNTTGIVEIINDTYLQGLSDIKVDGTSVLSTPKKNTVNIDDIDKEIRLEWTTIPSNCNFMFSSLTNILDIDLSSFIFSSVTSMAYMFYNCISLKSIKFDSSINTGSVKYMNSTLACCHSLESLDITNFQFSNVEYMGGMFYACHSLGSLDLSGKNMNNNLVFSSTFRDCFSLKSLVLTGVNADSAVNFAYMFANCYSLISLDLSSFNKVPENFLTMNAYMFNNCTSLIYVNMPSFFANKNNILWSMFSGCNNLQYLNIKDIYEDIWTTQDGIYNNIFENNPQNMVICIPDDAYKLKSFFSKNITCGVIDCTGNWENKQKKLNSET